MRAAIGLVLVASLAQSVARPAADWPPAGVYSIKDGATRPEVVTRVTPTYSPEAMRARIQGFVTLEFVVEPDGSVGPVHVITSLDIVNGLDVAAINALKQWRFKPGTRDGTPVRVLSTVVLSFGIHDLPPPMALPAGFDASPVTSAAGWIQETIDIGGVRIEFAYPEGWAHLRNATGAVTATDVRTFRSIAIMQPFPLPGPLPFPLAIPQLGQFSETMRQHVTIGRSAAEVVAVGQATVGNTNWLWLELEGAAPDLSAAPAGVAASMQNLFDGVHMWVFNTTAGSNLVEVMCGLPEVKVATPAERDNALAQARADCAGSLKRTSVTLR